MKDLVLQIARVTSFKQLSSLCYGHFLKLGVCHFSYFHFPPIGAIDFDKVKIILWLGYSDRWIETYQKNGYIENDPIVQRLAHAARPFWLGDLSNLTIEEAEYMKVRRACGIQDEYAIPVFGQSGRNGGYGIGFSENIEPLSDHQISEIQWICQNAHIRYCELLESDLKTKSKLSAREAQVLKLVALGKTNAQIATELSLSVKTIETYLSRVFDKMVVHDRMTAALRAIATGLVK